jgi:hypothetical protein
MNFPFPPRGGGVDFPPETFPPPLLASHASPFPFFSIIFSKNWNIYRLQCNLNNFCSFQHKAWRRMHQHHPPPSSPILSRLLPLGPHSSSGIPRQPAGPYNTPQRGLMTPLHYAATSSPRSPCPCRTHPQRYSRDSDARRLSSRPPLIHLINYNSYPATLNWLARSAEFALAGVLLLASVTLLEQLAPVHRLMQFELTMPTCLVSGCNTA